MRFAAGKVSYREHRYRLKDKFLKKLAARSRDSRVFHISKVNRAAANTHHLWRVGPVL